MSDKLTNPVYNSKCIFIASFLRSSRDIFHCNLHDDHGPLAPFFVSGTKNDCVGWQFRASGKYQTWNEETFEGHTILFSATKKSFALIIYNQRNRGQRHSLSETLVHEVFVYTSYKLKKNYMSKIESVYISNTQIIFLWEAI